MFTFRKNGHFYEKVSKKGEPVCIDEEIPFDIPDSWEWCRFGYVVDFSLGKTPPRKELIFWDNATTPWVTISDMVDGKIINCTQENVNNYALEKSFKGILVPKGTLLMSFKLTVGKVSILGLDAVHNEAIISIKPFIDNNNCFRDYLFRVLPLISQTGDTKSAIKGKTLNSKSLNKLLIPLPPLNEQRCIVNKIEDIMPFIEEYGVDKEQLDKLNSEFPDKLKSSILQEAIQGKLVSQDSNDEPSSVLLERIRNEKERLIKEKKIKRNKNESYIFKENNHFYEKIGNKESICIDNEIPFEIPESWIWCRLGGICNYGQVKSVDSAEINDDEWVLDLKDIEKGTGKLLKITTKKEVNSKSKKSCFFKDDVLYSKLRPYLNKVIIAHKKGFCTSEILPLNFGEYILPQYAKLVLMSPYFVDYANQCSYGTKMPRLGTSDGKLAFFPLAPLDEQKRIVEKMMKLYIKLNI